MRTGAIRKRSSGMKKNNALHGPLHDALRVVVGALERHKIPYALTGGLALAQHGIVRATEDIDLVLAIPQLKLPAVLESLRAGGCSLDVRKTIRAWLEHHIVQMEFRGVRIDWLAPVLPAFQSVLKSAVVRPIAGIPVRVASAEGLILLKLIAFREEDKIDVRGLLAVHEARLDLSAVREELLEIFEPEDQRFVWLSEAVEKPER